VLQVIWGDLFPRFAAFKWLNGSYPTPFGVGLISPADLTTSINSYMASSHGGDGTQAGSPFQKRVDMVLKYLAPPTECDVMPMRYLGEGGFDFILSDAGLDLFAPKAPKSDTELLRYYEFRETGKSTIGLPGYLDGSDALAFDVQSPVGPSQVWTSHLDIPINASGTCVLKNLDCLSVVEVDPDEACGPTAVTEGITDVSAGITDVGEDSTVPAGEGPRNLVEVRRGGDADAVDPSLKFRYGFTLQSFTATAAKVRCWQLEGSVYRGILEQLPRVVATVWRERLHATTYRCSVDPDSYSARWGNPDTMRDIFRERLETSLPRPAKMIFKVGAAPPDVERADPDVMITNRGITFPNITAPPSLTDMFKAISTGAAGNPVFTDTRRPPRDF